MIECHRSYDSDNDTIPKELFINHQAGLDGMGGSSYIDDVIRRDADEGDGSYNPSWHEETTGLDDTLYYLQNWRADVVVTVRPAADAYSDPALVDQVRYSANGVPWAISLADMVPGGGTGASPYSPDGELMYDDQVAFLAWFDDPDPDVQLRADIVSIGGTGEFPSPPDGQLTVDDIIAFVNGYTNDGSGLTPKRAVSHALAARLRGVRVRPGADAHVLHAGQRRARAMWHVRHRVLDSETGRWMQREPLGYADGMNLMQYVASGPLSWIDPDGAKKRRPGSPRRERPYRDNRPGRLLNPFDPLDIEIDPWADPPDPSELPGDGFSGNVSYGFQQCWPIGGPFSICVEASVESGVACCEGCPGTIACQSVFRACITAKLVITGTVPYRRTDRFGAGGGAVIGDDSCVGAPSGTRVEGELTGSIGYGPFTLGCRVSGPLHGPNNIFRDFPNNIDLDCGFGIGDGTGVSGSLCITTWRWWRRDPPCLYIY